MATKKPIRRHVQLAPSPETERAERTSLAAGRRRPNGTSSGTEGTSLGTVPPGSERAPSAPGSTPAPEATQAVAAENVEARAREALAHAPPQRVPVTVRLTPETVEKIALLARLRRGRRLAGSTKQDVIEDALARWIPAELARILGPGAGAGT